MKTCTQCKISQSEENFAYRNKVKGTRHAICKDCVKIRDQEHWNSGKKKESNQASKIRLIKRNKEWLGDFLASSTCIDCGNSDSRVLEFDHLRDKQYNISDLVKVASIETIQAEIAKCEVVCANCHRIRTYTREGSWRITMAL